MLCFTLYMMLLGERPYDTYLNLMTLLVAATTTIIKFTQENRTWLAISLAILLLNFGVALMLDNITGIQLNHWKTYILEDDESLRRWKEQLLGGVDVNAVAEIDEPDVKLLSLAIVAADRADIILEIPESGHPKGLWFTLKEGSKYNLKFTFKVSNNIVCGLKYTNTVWKTGIKVDSSKQMLGTFSPQAEPYIHMMTEETTPSGMFARGSYSAKTKFLDDDNKCYLELTYTFDIQKDWAK